MAASAHARLATEFGKGGKFKLAKDPRAHSAPAAQHRKAEGEGEAGEEGVPSHRGKNLGKQK